MKKTFSILVLVAVIGLIVGFVSNGILSNAFAAGVPDAPEIGTEAPDFELTDYAGKTHNLEMYKDKILVLNFSSQHCPFSRGADATINAIAEEFADEGVVFLGVDSHKSTTSEENAMHAEKANVPYPIAKDPENAYADLMGARVTPEIFVLNKGVVAYHGPPDNRMGPEGDASEHYLKDALTALVAGDPVKVTHKSAWGCAIKRAN